MLFAPLPTEARSTLAWLEKKLNTPDSQNILPKHYQPELARRLSRVITEGVKLWTAPGGKISASVGNGRPNEELLRELLLARGHSDHQATEALSTCLQAFTSTLSEPDTSTPSEPDTSAPSEPEYLIRLASRCLTPTSIGTIRRTLALLAAAKIRVVKVGRKKTARTIALEEWLTKELPQNPTAPVHTSGYGFWANLYEKVPANLRPPNKDALRRVWERHPTNTKDTNKRGHNC